MQRSETVPNTVTFLMADGSLGWIVVKVLNQV